VDSPATFIAVMAHELSHIVLHSLWHKEKDNEIYTDITAMMLGFSNIIKNGRKVIKTSTDYGFFSNTTTTRTETTTYGYLSNENFNFAFNKIGEILNKYKQEKNMLVSKIKELTKKLKKNRKAMLYFQKYLEYLDKNLNRKMSQEDGYKISTFHQAGYIDEFEQVVRKTESELKQFNNFVQNLNHYNENLIGTIRQYEEIIRATGNDLNLKRHKLRADVNVLKKHVLFGYKLKTFARVNFGK
jgi:molecular chaperone GrpE (heat shock protein)